MDSVRTKQITLCIFNLIIDCALQGERPEHALQDTPRACHQPLLTFRNEVRPRSTPGHAYGPYEYDALRHGSTTPTSSDVTKTFASDSNASSTPTGTSPTGTESRLRRQGP